MDLRTLHSDAMVLAEKAMVARVKGSLKSYRRFLAAALRKEKEAAVGAVEQGVPEPTRTIFLKSAAHLAIDAGELQLAERLIGLALSGHPPEELAAELRELFETIGFHRHLELRGVELQSNDVQMVLVGNAIAPGMAAADEFTARVETMKRLVQRTAESDRGISYREQGGPRQDLERSLRLYVSVPRAASFAVSLRVASEKGQAEFDYAESAQVLNHVLDRLGMYDRQDMAALQNAIPVPEYFENFLELASALAPDGDDVRLVGLTTSIAGKEKRLEMRTATRTRSSPIACDPPVGPREVVGRVFFFNARDPDSPQIKLQAEDGKEYRLRAAGNLLQRAVECAARGSRVRVTGIQIAKTVIQAETLQAIRGPKPRAQ